MFALFLFGWFFQVRYKWLVWKSVKTPWNSHRNAQRTNVLEPDSIQWWNNFSIWNPLKTSFILIRNISHPCSVSQGHISARALRTLELPYKVPRPFKQYVDFYDKSSQTIRQNGYFDDDSGSHVHNMILGESAQSSIAECKMALGRWCHSHPFAPFAKTSICTVYLYIDSLDCSTHAAWVTFHVDEFRVVG